MTPYRIPVRLRHPIPSRLSGADAAPDVATADAGAAASNSKGLRHPPLLPNLSLLPPLARRNPNLKRHLNSRRSLVSLKREKVRLLKQQLNLNLRLIAHRLHRAIFVLLPRPAFNAASSR